MATTELQLYGVMGKPHSFSAKTAAVTFNKICWGSIAISLPDMTSVSLSQPSMTSIAISLPDMTSVSLEEC